MNFDQLEEKLKAVAGARDEETFIYDLLSAYDIPKATISRLRSGTSNLVKDGSAVLLKKKVYFRVEKKQDLHAFIDDRKNDSVITKPQPRFLIVTDMKTLLAVDTKTGDGLDIPLKDLPKYYDFFLPWAGREKTRIQSENPADIKAAERMGRLYDLILESNSVRTKEERHALNVFLSRLLFCFFAEDTGIFEKDQFTNGVASHTEPDGRDLKTYLEKVFKVLSTELRKGLPKYLQDFPYVNGGLFSTETPVPKFTAKSRQLIIDCGSLNWKAINPDIFGSMIQAVVHDDDRSNLGMHYTSVTNIMKVIEPLFLNDLKAQLEAAGTDKKKVKAFLNRLYNLRIFDPACGSGNFLIIAYKELCKLEIEAFKILQGKQTTFSYKYPSKLRLNQFYGIEIDDFAHETAKLSLWLAEHQMNLAFREVFGEAKPTLPLQEGGNIVCGNATRLDWLEACPPTKGHEIYILGNPPYLGFSERNTMQVEDMDDVFRFLEGVKRLDYIACWLKLAADYVSEFHFASAAFVATSSICQGEQVSLIWPYIFQQEIELAFAHQPFKWSNRAKRNAGVSCVILGLRKKTNHKKILFSGDVSKSVTGISPYLVEGGTSIVEQRTSSLAGFPEMAIGSTSIDGGHLILSPSERREMISGNPQSAKYIRPFVGGIDYLRSVERYCLWIDDMEAEDALRIDSISERVHRCKQFRLKGGRDAKKGATIPYRFFYRKYQDGEAIVLPMTSSERRDYIPIDYVRSGTIMNHGMFVVYKAEPSILGILSSRMHMVWLYTVSGKLESRIRYAVNLVYNTFPFPKITEDQRIEISGLAIRVLDAREQFSERTLAELYDPDKMPEVLREAHRELDLAVERCYRKTPFKDDEERLAYLFKEYEKMIEAEKQG